MLHLGKRGHPAPPATADLADDPADRFPQAGRAGCGEPLGFSGGLRRLGSRRRCQVHTGRSTQGRVIRHAGALTLAVCALVVAMILPPPGGLLMAAVGLTALQAAGLFAAMRSAITLATITMTAEIEHRATGREMTHALTKDCGTGRWHRFCPGGLDNRRRSWQDDSRERTWRSFDRGHQ